MDIRKEYWGMTRDGHQASKYFLSNDNGMIVEISDFGALIVAIHIPCEDGLRDVALGYDTVEEYYNIDCGFGAYVGRNANRIASGKVTIDGVEYILEQNNGPNNLHSGSNRSHCQFYEAATDIEENRVWIKLERMSPDMEQGLPGNLQQSIRYALTSDNRLVIDYSMVSDKTTIINPTNHSYFNLGGHGSGDVLSHRMQIWADSFLPTDDTMIPTGEVRLVDGTPFDFRKPKAVGDQIDDDYEPLVTAGGYDHNYCLPDDGMIRNVAWLESPDRKVSMAVYTDLCGMQVYTGNFIQKQNGKNGAIYDKRHGICFETQFYPNACNDAQFPSSVFEAGVGYASRTIYAFHF